MCSPIELTGISDSVILTMTIYCVALFLRRDVAHRILGIMLIFVAFSLISRLIGFTPLIRVIDTILFSMPVILALIFQNDLRKALLMMGKHHTKSSRLPDDGAVDEVLQALSDMASRRIGALIVVVRNQPIEHLIQIGTDIDAKVTSELLNSIFIPYSPIHDGAVILHDSKITKAGCLLPLSQNPDISKSFGTRHRAALGLSELSDALVLVVSEETGKISAVHDSKITYDIDSADLKKLLKKSMEHHTQRN